MNGVSGVIAVQLVVHQSKSGQESVSQKEAKVAKEEKRNRRIATLIPVQVCTSVNV